MRAILLVIITITSVVFGGFAATGTVGATSDEATATPDTINVTAGANNQAPYDKDGSTSLNFTLTGGDGEFDDGTALLNIPESSDLVYDIENSDLSAVIGESDGTTFVGDETEETRAEFRDEKTIVVETNDGDQWIDLRGVRFEVPKSTVETELIFKPENASSTTVTAGPESLDSSLNGGEGVSIVSGSTQQSPDTSTIVVNASSLNTNGLHEEGEYVEILIDDSSVVRFDPDADVQVSENSDVDSTGALGEGVNVGPSGIMVETASDIDGGDELILEGVEFIGEEPKDPVSDASGETFLNVSYAPVDRLGTTDDPETTPTVETSGIADRTAPEVKLEEDTTSLAPGVSETNGSGAVVVNVTDTSEFGQQLGEDTEIVVEFNDSAGDFTFDTNQEVTVHSEDLNEPYIKDTTSDRIIVGLPEFSNSSNGDTILIGTEDDPIRFNTSTDAQAANTSDLVVGTTAYGDDADETRQLISGAVSATEHPTLEFDDSTLENDKLENVSDDVTLLLTSKGYQDIARADADTNITVELDPGLSLNVSESSLSTGSGDIEVNEVKKGENELIIDVAKENATHGDTIKIDGLKFDKPGSDVDASVAFTVDRTGITNSTGDFGVSVVEPDVIESGSASDTRVNTTQTLVVGVGNESSESIDEFGGADVNFTLDDPAADDADLGKSVVTTNESGVATVEVETGTEPGFYHVSAVVQDNKSLTADFTIHAAPGKPEKAVLVHRKDAVTNAVAGDANVSVFELHFEDEFGNVNDVDDVQFEVISNAENVTVHQEWNGTTGEFGGEVIDNPSNGVDLSDESNTTLYLAAENDSAGDVTVTVNSTNNDEFAEGSASGTLVTVSDVTLAIEPGDNVSNGTDLTMTAEMLDQNGETVTVPRLNATFLGDDNVSVEEAPVTFIDGQVQVAGQAVDAGTGNVDVAVVDTNVGNDTEVEVVPELDVEIEDGQFVNVTGENTVDLNVTEADSGQEVDGVELRLRGAGVDEMVQANGNDTTVTVEPNEVLSEIEISAADDEVLATVETIPGDVTGNGHIATDLGPNSGIEREGLYEDVDGDEEFDSADPQELLSLVIEDPATDAAPAFDFAGHDGDEVQVSDVQVLVDELLEDDPDAFQED